ncbi:hypothetical protein [Aquipuribacter sp. MA13-6]|uniref:hypothetical protein n=1 Tax=unclassified Aquipuribacter TaxID=2635084 RepID=UPI003EEA4137
MTAGAVGYALRAARAAAAVVVLSLLAALSMGLVHAETGGHPVGAGHVHDSVASVASVGSHAGDHDHGHEHPGERPDEPLGQELTSVLISASVAHDDPAEDDHHHHHLVDVDAGVVLDVAVAAPRRAAPLPPVTVTSVPASLSDGGGRPD